jgi:hypothetical protein
MRSEAAETEHRCVSVVERLDGKTTAITSKARETEHEAMEMLRTYVESDADALDGFEFLVMAEFAIPIQERHSRTHASASCDWHARTLRRRRLDAPPDSAPGPLRGDLLLTARVVKDPRERPLDSSAPGLGPPMPASAGVAQTREGAHHGDQRPGRGAGARRPHQQNVGESHTAD